MHIRYFLVLLAGIMIGGTSTAFAFRLHLGLDPSTVIASVFEAYDTDDAGPSPAEHQLFEEHIATTTTPLVVVHQELALSSEATATSSPRSVKIPVMIYHSVRPHITGESALQDQYDVTPDLLEQELVYIKDHGYTTITFADVVASFDAGAPLPEKPVILSFDDGWKNQYTYAFPLLQKYGMQGTFFIFTNPIDKKPHWMTWGEIGEMDKAGMEIVGHSRTHPILTKIATDAELDKEIAGGKAILEQHLGHPVTIFAYPFGALNSRVEAAVTRAGYLLARTTYWGVWNDPEHRLEFHGALSTDRLGDFEQVLNKK